MYIILMFIDMTCIESKKYVLYIHFKSEWHFIFSEVKNESILRKCVFKLVLYGNLKCIKNRFFSFYYSDLSRFFFSEKKAFNIERFYFLEIWDRIAFRMEYISSWTHVDLIGFTNNKNSFSNNFKRFSLRENFVHIMIWLNIVLSESWTSTEITLISS